MQRGQRRGILWGVVIAAVLLLLAAVFVDEDATVGGNIAAMSLLVLILVAILLYTRWSVYKKLVEPKSDIGNARIGDVVEIEGRLEAQNETLPAPFSQNETLGMLWRVDEKQGNIRYQSWNTILAGAGTADPVLKTSDGKRVTLDIGPLVEDFEINTKQFAGISISAGSNGFLPLSRGVKVDDVAFDIEHQETVYTLEPDDDVPNHITSFLQQQGVEKAEAKRTLGTTTRGTRKFYEGRLTDGDHVFVRAEVTDTGFDEATVGPVQNGPTIVTDRTKEEYITSFQTAIYGALTLTVIHGTAFLLFIAQSIL